MITPGDVDDLKPLEYKAFVEFIYGKLVGAHKIFCVNWKYGIQVGLANQKALLSG